MNSARKILILGVLAVAAILGVLRFFPGSYTAIAITLVALLFVGVLLFWNDLLRPSGATTTAPPPAGGGSLSAWVSGLSDTFKIVLLAAVILFGLIIIGYIVITLGVNLFGGVTLPAFSLSGNLAATILAILLTIAVYFLTDAWLGRGTAWLVIWGVWCYNLFPAFTLFVVCLTITLFVIWFLVEQHANGVGWALGFLLILIIWIGSGMIKISSAPTPISGPGATTPTPITITVPPAGGGTKPTIGSGPTIGGPTKTIVHPPATGGGR